MKVLFVGAGKRLEMAKKFANQFWRISSYEYETECPIKSLPVKIIKGLKWADPKIKEDIQKLSSNFDLVLPFQDEATKLLSELKPSNVNFCVSDYETTNCCLNKDLFEKKFFHKDYYPRALQNESAIIKPVRGFGSKGIQIIDCFQADDNFYTQSEYVYQRKITGGHEYSVDCYFDKKNKLIDFVPRKRIETANGEVVKSVTVKKNDFEFERLINDISKELKFTGPICMQFISDSSNKLWIMEINARFGGGATLSIAAGFDMVNLLTKEYYEFKEIDSYYSIWESGLHLSRCFVDYYHHGN